ncbi:hypothetical protein HQ41_03210 [Porphyromonas sp. COT-290 OH860]|nr:hypothetical protein HQ41_03210 [Porphyromonas sp. COT-290 OH860]
MFLTENRKNAVQRSLSSRFLLLDAVFFNLGVLPLYPDLVSNEPQNPRFEDTSPRSGQKELLISKLENLYKLRKHNERRDKLIEWTCAMVSRKSC